MDALLDTNLIYKHGGNLSFLMLPFHCHIRLSKPHHAYIVPRVFDYFLRNVHNVFRNFYYT